MPIFRYEGFTKEGRPVKGTKEAINKQTLLLELSSQNILVSEVKEKEKSKKLNFFQNIFKRNKNNADYYFQLSLLLKSGIPLVQAQNIIVKNIKSQKERDIITDTTSKVTEGIKFSEALSVYEDYFDPMYVNLIKTSERVGHLPQILMDIAEYEESKKKTADKLKSAIIYPATIMTLGISILVFLLTVIVPRIEKIFATAKQDIPSITKLMLFLSNFVRSYGTTVFIVIIASVFIFRYYYKNNKSFALKIDKRLFKIDLVAQSTVTRFSHILAFQLKEGLPLTEALYYATETVSNRFFKQTMENVRTSVQEGVKFSIAVRETGIFPDLLPAAVATGETSGNMPELLERVAEFYNKQVDKYISGFLSVIEPLFIVIIGGMVGFIVLAIMLPLFEINTIVG